MIGLLCFNNTLALAEDGDGGQFSEYFSRLDVPQRGDALFEDRNGVAWTIYGLKPHIFDGQQFVRPATLDTPREVIAGIGLKDGGLLFLSPDGQGYHFPPGSTEWLSVPSPYPDGKTAELFELHNDVDGSTWLMGYPGLHRFDPVTSTFVTHAIKGLSEVFTRPDGSYAVYSMLPSPNGGFWLGIEAGVVETDRSFVVQAEHHSSRIGSGDPFMVGAMVYASDRLWLFSTSGLFRHDSGGFKAVPVSAVLDRPTPVETPYFFGVSSNGDELIAVSDPGGLFVFAADMTSGASLSSEESFWRAAHLSDGTAWAAGPSGMARIGTPQTLPSHEATDYRTFGWYDVGGRELVLTARGLEQWSESGLTLLWSLQDKPQGAQSPLIRFVDILPSSNSEHVDLVGYSTLCRYTFATGAMMCNATLDDLGLRSLNNVTFHDGRLWILSLDTIAAIEGSDVLDPARRTRVLPGQQSTAFLGLDQGQALIGTLDGLQLADLDKETVDAPFDDNPVFTKSVRDLDRIPGGDLLLTTYIDGAYRLSPTLDGVEDFLPASAVAGQIVSATVSDSGRIFFLGSGGMVVTDLAARVVGSNAHAIFPGEVSNRPVDMTSLSLSGDTAWLTYPRGVVRFSPDIDFGGSSEIRVHSFRIDGNVAGSYPGNIPSALEIESGETLDIVLRSTGTTPAPIYGAIDGQDVKSLNNGRLSLQAPAPGSYTFAFSTRADLQAAKSLTVNVRPQWHERTSLRLAAAMGLIIPALATFYLLARIRRARREFALREATIQESHHRIKNSLQTVAALMEMSENKVGEEEIYDSLRERISSIARVHDKLSNHRSGPVPLHDLVTHLSRDMAEVYGMADALQINVNAHESASLDSGDALIAGMIFSEWLSNAFKHGRITPDTPVEVTVDRNKVSVANKVFQTIDRVEDEPGIGSQVVELLSRQSGFGVSGSRHNDVRSSTLSLTP